MPDPFAALSETDLPPGVRLVPLRELRPAPWNPREIDDPDFVELMLSIQADPMFMWLRPVLAQGDGEIYAGNQRFRAVEQLGGVAVPGIVEDVDPVLARRRALIDNNNNGRYTAQLLAESVAFIDAGGGSRDGLGFKPGELEALMVLPVPAEEPTPPGQFPVMGADLPTDYQCPKCGYEWSGKSGG